jgi:hypothetical protein
MPATLKPWSSPARRYALRMLPLLAAIAAMPSRADDHAARVPLLPAYRAECSACHVAYPPGMLPAASWARLLHGLPRHFGTDASLDPATVTQLSTWLAANAATGRRAAEPPQDRITQSAWFVRKHREVPTSAWQRAAVKSPANCAACHGGAEQGNFDEHAVRIPR